MMKSPDKKLAQDNSPAMEGRDTLQEQSLPIGNGYIGANIWLLWIICAKAFICVATRKSNPNKNTSAKRLSCSASC